MSNDRKIHRARRLLASARRLAVLTGAGISAESGVATFRQPGGLWEAAPADQIATAEGFTADPPGVWQWYHERRREMAAARPNAAHVALADLERRVTGRGGELTLITQNVDGLHAKAGSRNILHVHGCLADVRCTHCEFRQRVGMEPIEDLPTCPRCQAVLRPDVVWFGEPLPADAWRSAVQACEACDMFLTIGTSAIVYPAAGLIELAIDADAKTVEINVAPTPVSGLVDIALQGPAGEILPKLLQ